jgi:hypothetical protein
MRRHAAPLVAVLLLAPPLFGGSPNQAYYSRRLAPKEHPVRKVLVLPAYVQLTKSSLKGKLGMTAQAEPLAARITAFVGQALRNRQVEVLPDPFTEESLERDEELRGTLTRLQGHYDALSAQLHAKPKEVRKSRYSLGDEVATLRPAEPADAIVFIRGTHTVMTGGKTALNMFGHGEDLTKTNRTILSFADAKSGEILAYVQVMTMGDLINQPEKTLGKPLAKLLKKIPFTPK